MFTKEGILALHGWTHERIDLLLDHAATLSPSDLARELPGFGQATLRDQLGHLLGAEERWVHRLQDLPLPQWTATTVESMRTAKARVKRETVAYVGRLSEAELNTKLTHQPKEWIGSVESPGFILHHVITHAFHHKGQVVAMFRLLGHPAPDTDLQR